MIKQTSFAQERRDLNTADILYVYVFLCSVLRSEVDDVKCLLQAAERQVDSLKKERDMESIESARRLAALESKVCDDQNITAI